MPGIVDILAPKSYATQVTTLQRIKIPLNYLSPKEKLRIIVKWWTCKYRNYIRVFQELILASTVFNSDWWSANCPQWKV